MRARDVMTTIVIAVSPRTSLREVTGLFIRNRISGVPVLDDAGKLVGIVSRANLLHGIGTQDATMGAGADLSEVRTAIQKEMADAGAGTHQVNAIVTADEVQLWGWVDDEQQSRAIEVAAAAKSGGRRVTNNVAVMPAQLKAAYGGV